MLNKILEIWYLAHKQAEDNASLMLKSSLEVNFSDLCGARMSVIREVDRLLYNIVPHEMAPKVLTKHLKAEKEKTDCSCNYSSILKNQHPECIEQRSEWFTSQKELLDYIETNIIKVK